MGRQQRRQPAPGYRRQRHPGIQIEEAPVGSLLLQVVRAHALLATEMLAELGLVPPQEVVLLYLDDHGPCPQQEIVHFMGRDRSTVTNTLQAMERAGLIHRERSQSDARALIVSLSPRGRALIPQVRETWARIEAATVGGLSPVQAGALVDGLRRVKEGLWDALDGRRQAD